jgi:Lecithin:cholesterol acyltransferase
MAKPNIVFLPGLFGSRLGVPALLFNPAIDFWPNPLFVATGIMLQLELAADGVSPGPHTRGIVMQPLGLVEWAYGPMDVWLRQQPWNVLSVPYDWRLSVRQSAIAVLAAIQAAYQQQPIVFVAHSMGCIVARTVYRLLLDAGFGAQVAGLVEMGAPNFGSWAIVRGFFGLEPFYAQLKSIAGLIGPYFASYRADFLDLIVASWPGWYELAPWRDSGPLALADPATAQALYQAATYSGGNPYVSQAWLNAAPITQDYLAPAIPFNHVVCIRGNGFVTANQRNVPNPLSQLNGYAYTNGGDGTMPLDYATVFHGDMPRDPKVWAAVKWAVGSLVGPGA